MKVDGKTVVVTGGARGIGKVLCLRFAREGARVGNAREDGSDTATTLAPRLRRDTLETPGSPRFGTVDFAGIARSTGCAILVAQ